MNIMRSSYEMYRFEAIESLTGDIFTGSLKNLLSITTGSTDIGFQTTVYGTEGIYEIDHTYSFGNDEIGGKWEYKILSVTAHSVLDEFIASGALRIDSYYDAESNQYATGFRSVGGIWLGSAFGEVTFDGVNYDRFGLDGYYVADATAKYTFYAIESVSGDVIEGFTYDAPGKYQNGHTIYLGSNENGGTWAYHIYDVQGGGVAQSQWGEVYDKYYYDAESGTWGQTLYGYNGEASGRNGIGSDFDYVNFQDPNYGPSSYDLIGSNGYYEADLIYSGMKKYLFYAVESESGDVIQGYAFDNTGQYYEGWQKIFAGNEAGGEWRYNVYAVEDARLLGPSAQGRVYDTNYYDAETKTWLNTYTYLHDLGASGEYGIGSDADNAVIDGNDPATRENLFGSGGYYEADFVNPSGTIEPDDFVGMNGSRISSALATFSVVGHPSDYVTASPTGSPFVPNPFTSTGNLVFAGGSGPPVVPMAWDSQHGLLRVDFNRATNRVTIDIGFDDGDIAVMRAYDAQGDLLESVVTPEFRGQYHTVGIERTVPDIAYIEVGGAGTDAVFLDHLTFGSNDPSIHDGFFIT